MNRTLAMLALAGTIVPGLAMAQNSGAPPTMTEPQARSAMTAFGCSNLSTLGQGPGGSWYGQCSKGGQTVNVTTGPDGKVTTGGRPSHMTEGNARYALTQAGCSNISALKASPDGSWHGQCTRGGSTVNMAVNAQGQAAKE